ncbi:MAG: DUF523 domain-containing protein [Eubacteriales bacterium]|nr:DUF523 domain-containing protein [Eubacteriales bacterium]
MDDSSHILVSACLLGVPCRYDGTGQADERILALAKTCHLIPVCPEQLGGLPTPRPSAERNGTRVLTRDDRDVTAPFLRGAQETRRLARLFACRIAILKANSPSCGSGQIYDGCFCGRLIPGDGMTAALLKQDGLTVLSEKDDLSSLF